MSRGRVRRFRNDTEGYEGVLRMGPSAIVVEPTGAHSTGLCQYFKGGQGDADQPERAVEGGGSGGTDFLRR